MANFSFIETEDGMPDILQHKLDRSGHFLQLIGNILRGPSELSVAERELIFAYVSGCNSCTFCFGAHKAVAQAFGIGEELLDELVNAEVPAAAGAKMQPCLVLAKKAARDASRIVKADIDAVVDAGWQEETAQDVIYIAAIATYCNILVDGYGVVGSPAYFQREVDTFGPGGSYEEVAHSSF
jgi:AhpD family alkylhydroperoxidase